MSSGTSGDTWPQNTPTLVIIGARKKREFPLTTRGTGSKGQH